VFDSKAGEDLFKKVFHNVELQHYEYLLNLLGNVSQENSRRSSFWQSIILKIKKRDRLDERVVNYHL